MPHQSKKFSRLLHFFSVSLRQPEAGACLPDIGRLLLIPELFVISPGANYVLLTSQNNTSKADLAFMLFSPTKSDKTNFLSLSPQQSFALYTLTKVNSHSDPLLVVVLGVFLSTRECPRSVMVKAMDCGIVVSEFILQSRYYVYFQANTLGKGMNPLILPAMG